MSSKESLALRFLYNTSVGRMILKPLVSPAVSEIAGKFMDSPLSKCMIKSFIRKNNINMDDYKDEKYSCFNDFFTRKIKEERRPVDFRVGALIAPSDGKLSAYRIKRNTTFNIKRSRYSVASILQDEKLAKKYEGGTALIFRLCVDNYHRYCFVDDGFIEKSKHIDGILHTVRPIAVESFEVFSENTREVTVMETDNFGTVTQIEVGAMLIGKIDNYKNRGRFSKGEEKGRFLYGGSTVMLLLEKGAARFPKELFELSKDGRELNVKYGSRIGYRSN